MLGRCRNCRILSGGSHRLADVGGKDVTQPANGADQFGLVRIDFDLAAQPHDQHVDSAIEDLQRFAVGQLQQAIAGQYFTRMLYQRQQQTVFALSQIDSLALRVVQRAAVGVQTPAVELPALRSGLADSGRFQRQRTGTAQNRLGASDHHAWIKGLAM